MNNSRPRICILRHNRYPWDARVPKEAAALLAEGYAVEVICLADTPNRARRETHDGIEITRLPVYHRRGSAWRYLCEYAVSFSLMAAFVTWRHLRHPYALIQVNTMPDALVFATLIPRMMGCPILLDMHEPAPELCAAERAPNRLLSRMLVATEQAAIRYAHRVITVNDAVRNRFIKRGAPPEKISVVRNVPPSTFGCSRSADTSSMEMPFTVVTHGTLRALYGHQVLIDAANLLRRDIPDLRVMVVGDGECAHELRAAARTAGCSDIVTFTGEVAYEDIPATLCQAHVGVVTLRPSSFGALCQPNKLFEYVTLQIPVAAPRLPAIQETFDENSVAYYTADDPSDLARQLLSLYRNPNYRIELAASACRRFQDVDWNASRREYIRQANAIVNDKPRHASDPASSWESIEEEAKVR